MYIIDRFVKELDDEEKKQALEELADEPSDWVLENLNDEIYDMDSKLGQLIWRYGYENIDFDYIRDIYILQYKAFDEELNKQREE